MRKLSDTFHVGCKKRVRQHGSYPHQSSMDSMAVWAVLAKRLVDPELVLQIQFTAYRSILRWRSTKPRAYVVHTNTWSHRGSEARIQ